MPKEFRFPDVGEGITEGEIVKWLVKEGDRVKQDQPLVQVETDKAVVDLPSPYVGAVVRLHGKEGDIIKVGDVLVTIAETGEAQKTPAAPVKKDSGSVVGHVEEAPEETESEPLALPGRTRGVGASALPGPAAGSKGMESQMNDVLAVPAVRSLAKELGLDLTGVKGTGPGGRVTRQDVEKAAASRQTTGKGGKGTSDLYGEVVEVRVRGLRRSTAKHMSEAARVIVPVTHMDEADITALEEIRTQQKEAAQKNGVRLTYLPFVIKALIAGLKLHPFLNATLDMDKDVIVLKKYYNIGIAVDTPDGLMVFVIKDADQKSILDLAKVLNDLTQKAHDRTISLTDLKGGTFSITNYGVIRGIHGTPVINYPEVGILGIGRITDRPVVKGGQIVIRRILPLSLTFDHRVVDGADAARFMNVIIHRMEDPNLLLIEAK
jgi:pyruvate dehydrogenase E2 component (dihydrolipoamide acetyltransferase)